MASWAGAYGAGGAADALQQLVAQKFLERKQAEMERAQRVQEAQAQAEMAQRGDHFRQGQQLQLTTLAADRDERYQDRTQRVGETNARMQRETLQDQIRAKERTEDYGFKNAEREDEQKQRGEELRSRQSFEQAMMAAQRGPVDEMKRLQLDAEKKKQADAQAAASKQEAAGRESTQAAFDSVNRLLDPKGVGGGLDSSYGAYEMRGSLQSAQDFKAERDRFVAMLALPNLGALKGPMSDKDLAFIKAISSTLSNDNISEQAARDEMTRARSWLMDKGAVDTSTVAMLTPDGRSVNVPAAQVAEAEKRGAKRR